MILFMVEQKKFQLKSIVMHGLERFPVLVSEITTDAVSVKAINAIVKLFDRNKIYDCLRFWHQGYCGRCGKVLTVPKSIEQGFGPVCVDLA